METYTIEPVLDPGDQYIEVLLDQMKAVLSALEMIIRDVKTPLPVIELDE